MCENESKRLLVADVGNTNVVFGVFRDHRLEASIRVETRRDRTAEEYQATIVPLLQYRNIPWDQFGDFLISSVVPPAQRALSELGLILLGKAPRFVTSDMEAGVELRYHQPREMGADRIVNAGYCYHRWKGCIVVDFGTATTFDVLSPCIVPGVRISMEALFTRASRLPRIDVVRPDRAIGRSTEEAMQSGVYFGYVALVDGIVERVFAEAGFRGPVIATGGLASLVAGDSKAIEIVEPDLALLGLQWLYQRQRG